VGVGAGRRGGGELVRRGQVSGDGRKVDIPSMLVRAGDEVAVREKSRKIPSIAISMEARRGQGVPDWLELKTDSMSGRVLNIPTRDSIPVPINEQLIVELYSK